MRTQTPGQGYIAGPTLSERTRARKKAAQRAMLRKIERELREQAKEGKHGQASNP